MKRNLLFLICALCLGGIALLSVMLVNFFYPKQYVQDDKGEYVNVVTAANQETFPITKDTNFVMEYYYVNDDRKLTEELSDIPDLLGLDKEQLKSYLKDYMINVPNEDKEQGLVSYELVGYTKNTITLRKTYEDKVSSGYCAKSFNGTVVILNGDEKTVYEYTQIPIHTLPEDIREKVIRGYYLENDEDLYSFLENYSS